MGFIRIGKLAAAAAAVILVLSASPAWGAEVVGSGAAAPENQDAVTGPGVAGPGASGGRHSGELPSGTQVVTPDTDVPENTGSFGYTREDAAAVVEAVLSYEQDPVSKEIASSYLMSQIWYDPQNLMTADTGERVLMLYCGPMENYGKSWLEALDGLEFFSNPVVLFLADSSGSLIVGVQTGDRFTEQQAAENYQITLKLQGMLEEVRSRTFGMEQGDAAKYICDYVADHLDYDPTYAGNAIGAAVGLGKSACVGYNALTELLFRHAGMRYCSVVATEINGDVEHIFGLAEVSGHWMVFDTTNYDRDESRDPFWIFSDRYREGMYYKDFYLVGDAADLQM